MFIIMCICILESSGYALLTTMVAKIFFPSFSQNLYISIILFKSHSTWKIRRIKLNAKMSIVVNFLESVLSDYHPEGCKRNVQELLTDSQSGLYICRLGLLLVFPSVNYSFSFSFFAQNLITTSPNLENLVQLTMNSHVADRPS